ncbi:hypothetical protein EVAR_22958_1 [Eumeta japonica]|uniref:Uncharacterized protein n=1 Tax=Eumeta variegata TaxID=151549 RepID=A0A4C1UPZ1_EUMVA|nr:hypothetical protein EVAR_22958_1 [Eumeta japonica]
MAKLKKKLRGVVLAPSAAGRGLSLVSALRRTAVVLITYIRRTLCATTSINQKNYLGKLIVESQAVLSLVHALLWYRTNCLDGSEAGAVYAGFFSTPRLASSEIGPSGLGRS